MSNWTVVTGSIQHIMLLKDFQLPTASIIKKKKKGGGQIGIQKGKKLH